uniref:Uncharacterized protein n=1 Tax=Setaria viridis TaxID=4556 RepID=A0A4V6D539_SETVI|nr:hypothetical protein SEVIR_6G053050v2 [Setaria viridis]
MYGTYCQLEYFIWLLFKMLKGFTQIIEDVMLSTCLLEGQKVSGEWKERVQRSSTCKLVNFSSNGSYFSDRQFR